MSTLPDLAALVPLDCQDVLFSYLRDAQGSGDGSEPVDSCDRKGCLLWEQGLLSQHAAVNKVWRGCVHATALASTSGLSAALTMSQVQDAVTAVKDALITLSTLLGGSGYGIVDCDLTSVLGMTESLRQFVPDVSTSVQNE